VFSLSDKRAAYRIIAMFTIAHLQTSMQGVLSFNIYLRNNYANVMLKYSVNTIVKVNVKMF
jgi:hypothetical protein